MEKVTFPKALGGWENLNRKCRVEEAGHPVRTLRKAEGHEQRTLLRVRAKTSYRRLVGTKAEGICDSQTAKGLTDSIREGSVPARPWGLDNVSVRLCRYELGWLHWHSGVRANATPSARLLWLLR